MYMDNYVEIDVDVVLRYKFECYNSLIAVGYTLDIFYEVTELVENSKCCKCTSQTNTFEVSLNSSDSVKLIELI